MGRSSIIRWRTDAPFDWAGEVVAIVASGPSARATDFSLLKDRTRVIAVNLSWQLVPWADVLYATDSHWWVAHHGVKEFTGRKFTSSDYAAKLYGLDVIYTDGCNSGVRAIALANMLSARCVLLIGFDMHDRDGLHWHAPHSLPMHNPGRANMRMWRDETAKLRFAGTVINCTPGSALTRFPQMTLEEALDANYSRQSRADQSRHRAVSQCAVAGGAIPSVC